MRELSMHILDLAQNSITAGAKDIEIEVSADTRTDLLAISIRDDGMGISPDMLARVRDPFVTSRKTRRVGLGIPMFVQAARSCCGDVDIQSTPGKGTEIAAVFKLSHIDRAPLGDIASTLVALIAANPDISFCYVHRMDEKEFVLDTDDVKVRLDGVPINEGPVLKWIGEYVRENAAGDLEIV